MVKFFKTTKEIFLNLLMLFLMMSMMALMILNWTKGLNVDSVPEDFFAYKFVNYFASVSENENIESHGEKLAVPTKIAIKTFDETFSIMYDEEKINRVYREMFNIAEDITKIDLEEVSFEEFYAIFEQDEYVYIEFLCPLSAIINVETDVFVTDMVIINNESNSELYIKSKSEYYRITLKNINIKYNSETDIFSLNNEIHLEVNGIVNLIGKDILQMNKADVLEVEINEEAEKSIATTFFYNPAVATGYEVNLQEKIYVNEYSTLSIRNDYIQFESKEPRGNIYKQSQALNNSQMIEVSMSIFNSIYSDINSKIIAHPIEIYNEDGQTTVILTGKYNGVEITTTEPLGLFRFTANGLTYCKVKTILFKETEQKVMLANIDLLATEYKQIVAYDLDGMPKRNYYFDEG